MGRLSVERFVEYYMTAHLNGQTRDEFAHSLGVSPATVYMRAAELRRHGVPLPAMPLSRKKSVIERAMEQFEKSQAAHKRIAAKHKEAADRRAAMLPQYEVTEKKIKQFVKQRMSKKKK